MLSEHTNTVARSTPRSSLQSNLAPFLSPANGYEETPEHSMSEFSEMDLRPSLNRASFLCSSIQRYCMQLPCTSSTLRNQLTWNPWIIGGYTDYLAQASLASYVRRIQTPTTRASTSGSMATRKANPYCLMTLALNTPGCHTTLRIGRTTIHIQLKSKMVHASFDLPK